MVENIDAIVQARLGSSRFPEKLFIPIHGKPLLAHCLGQLKKCSRISRIIVATTTSANDDPIEKYCAHESLRCYRGPVDEVLNRYLGASYKFNSDRFLRVCSDNPFIDVRLMENQINAFGPEDDYCSYYTKANEPIIVKPIGLFVEAVTRQALERSSSLAKGDPKTQEHVTYYIHSHPDKFKINKLDLPSFVDPDLRFTVDYPEDIAVSEYIIEQTTNLNSQNLIDLVQRDTKLRDMILKITNRYPKLYEPDEAPVQLRS
jgi:spore coat polysaccharide biosynthesis protein SpsF